MFPRFRDRLRHADVGEIVVLIAVLIVVSGAFAFIKLTDEVREQGTQRFDARLIRAMRQPGDPSRPIGPGWLAEVGRDVTALGGVAVLSLMILAVAGYLAIRRKWGPELLVLAASIGGLLISSALKHLVSRPRPTEVPHLSMAFTLSFPSGHSLMSAVVYLTLGTLLARFVSQWRVKVYFMLVALVLTFLVGVSRVYMGVHYPTDVLAGWMAGLVWAAACWLVSRYIRWRREDVDA